MKPQPAVGVRPLVTFSVASCALEVNTSARLHVRQQGGHVGGARGDLCGRNWTGGTLGQCGKGHGENEPEECDAHCLRRSVVSFWASCAVPRVSKLQEESR